LDSAFRCSLRRSLRSPRANFHQPMARTAALLVAAVGFASLVAGSSEAAGSAANADVIGVSSAAASCVTRVVAAGDMNSVRAARRTGSLAKSLHPDVVAVLGDLAYPNGSLRRYRKGYDRTPWGKLKKDTRPVPGNHDYRTKNAKGYFTYFGYPPRRYAYKLGCGWRAYALNSEAHVARQARWLRKDLRAHPDANVVAYWHRPRFSSGQHGSDRGMRRLWAPLAGRTAVVLNGHEHSYERFARKDQRQQFVVGTGGSSTYPFRRHRAVGSVKRITGSPGVLVLRLVRGGYTWRFLNVHSRVLDSGKRGTA
jgi:3',5'-cyclic AMP phosphodiesterase CpdA